MLDSQRAGLMAPCRPVVVAQFNVEAKAACALGEQVTIAKAYEIAGQLATRDGQAQFRPNTGRLAGSQRNARMAPWVVRGRGQSNIFARGRGAQSLSST